MKVFVFHSTNNLLYHVTHGNDTGSTAMLINYDRDLRMLRLKHLHQFGNRKTFRNCLDSTNAQILHRRALWQQIGIFDMDKTDDVIFIFLVNRITGELISAHNLKIRCKIVVKVNCHHFGARCHDRFGIFIVEVEDVIKILILILFNRT